MFEEYAFNRNIIFSSVYSRVFIAILPKRTFWGFSANFSSGGTFLR
jgi:hypothetical protein